LEAGTFASSGFSSTTGELNRRPGYLGDENGDKDGVCNHRRTVGPFACIGRSFLVKQAVEKPLGIEAP
jgi:hypothetical protein